MAVTQSPGQQDTQTRAQPGKESHVHQDMENVLVPRSLVGLVNHLRFFPTQASDTEIVLVPKGLVGPVNRLGLLSIGTCNEDFASKLVQFCFDLAGWKGADKPWIRRDILRKTLYLLLDYQAFF